MARPMRVSSLLVVYDGPEVILGEDAFASYYVGLLTQRGPEVDTYVVSAVTPGRLDDLFAGRVDLRSVFEEPEEGLLRTTEWSEELGNDWVELADIANIPDSWLPDAGFLISNFVPEVDAEDAPLQAEAVARNRAVVQLELGRHTAVGVPRIEAEILSGALHAFQLLVKQALRRSIRNLDRSLRDNFAEAYHHELEVYAFSPGSFRVHMQAKSLPDLFGGTSIERAFERIDAMIAASHSPEESLAVVKGNRGHLASAYSRLLEFVKESDKPLRYGWTTPGSEVTRRRIYPEQASVLLEVFRQEKELGSEWRELVGVFTKVNTKTGSWTLEDEAGRDSHGSLHEEADDLLSGVVVKEMHYKLTCEEILAEAVGSGRQKTKLLLRHLEPH